MHALGHVIALNDITDEWDYLWDPTIMKSHTFISESNTEVWSGFSENDIAQLQQLYPIPTTEFSFEWSGSDSTSELLCQTNSTISVEVTQSGGNQTDYTVEYTVDADESDYIVSEWGNTLEFSFLKAGTYTVTVTPVAEEETFAGKTVEIVVYDVPEMSYSWSPALPNTENKFQINKPYNLTIEGVDSEFDVTVTIAAETSGNEYTCTKVNNREYQITFEDLGAYDITLKVKRGTRTLITETIAVTAVGEATFNYSWNPMVDSSGYLSRETDYTLQVDYVNEYYGNVVLYYAAYYQRENVTSSVLQSSNGNSAVFNFNMPGEYNIIVSAFKNGTKIDSKNIECVVSGSWFDLPEDPVLELNKEYTISLIHIDPNYEDVEIVFDVTEKLFDRTSENITKTQINDNTIKITLKDYGCYYVTASVYSSGTLIETKYANITHLYRISDPQFTLYDCTLISSEGYYGTWSLGYQVKFGSAATMQGRFGCYVEQETERRRGYPIIERRMDRQWTQKLIPIKINKSKSTTFNLSRGGLVYEDNYTTAVCTYYTGSVFYPKEGFRNTESLDLLDLPMIEVETEVNNITGIPSEF